MGRRAIKLAAVFMIIILISCGRSPTDPEFVNEDEGPVGTEAASIDGMVYIPAGNFNMGNNHTTVDDDPLHGVYLDGYYIDKFEVTNAQYAKFMNEAMSVEYIQYHSGDVTRRDIELMDLTDAQIRWAGDHFVAQPGKEDYPAIEITWYGAAAYAAFNGKRLPTEAEWEKAARGTDGRRYPWGNDPPTDQHCNFDSETSANTPVGFYSPLGDSPYGVSDMAGNVAEWCADYYDRDYYNSASARRNPQGPSEGFYRIIRGGAWYLGANFIQTFHRFRDRPDHKCSPYGFRCALSEAG